ncbi:hypothetical protein Tco_0595900 [Tanacetum coccineum]
MLHAKRIVVNKSKNEECKLYDDLISSTLQAKESRYHGVLLEDSHLLLNDHEYLHDATGSNFKLIRWEGQLLLLRDTSRLHSGASRSNYKKQQRTVIRYIQRGTVHMSSQCTKPKRKRDDSWFKEKVLLVQAQAHGQILNKEKLAILANLDIPEGQGTQTVITHNAAYQADDLDAYDSD